MFVDEKQQGEVQVPKLGTLKLSTAMRIGAQMRPKCMGAFFSQGGSCAWGAAYEGATGHPLPKGITHGLEIGRVFDKYRDIDFRFKIVSMNDSGQSREQIADWLESQGY